MEGSGDSDWLLRIIALRMSGLLPSFLRSGTSNTESNAGGTSSNPRRTSISITNPPPSSSIPTTITPEEWRNRQGAVNLSRTEMNRLVMNYLVVEGYKDAAERFSRETGMRPTTDLAAIEERVQIRSAIQKGDISTAIDRINEIDADLLDNNARIAFHLAQQQMIELIRNGQMQEALEFAQEELAPRAETHPEHLRDLERTMTLLVFEHSKPPMSELLDPLHRVKIANEVNAALLAMQSQEKESKLPALLKILYWAQEMLGQKTIFPKIVDFVSARFEPPLPTGKGPE